REQRQPPGDVRDLRRTRHGAGLPQWSGRPAGLRGRPGDRGGLRQHDPGRGAHLPAHRDLPAGRHQQAPGVKRALASLLKVGVPLAIGVWLVFYFYRSLDPAQRDELFAAFRRADMGWLAVATLVGWFSHVGRAWRWRYILEPLGHRPG